MALGKTVATPFGVDAQYHNILSVQIHYRDACCDVVMASYVSEAVRRAGGLPLGTVPSVRLALADLDDGPEPSRPSVYAALKRLDAWSDATDQ